MRQNKKLLLTILICTFLISIASAQQYELFVKPLDSNGNVFASTSFNYQYNFTTDSACTNTIYQTPIIPLTTNQYGEAFVNFSVPTNITLASYVCEYQNSVLRASLRIGDAIFADIYSSGNISTNYFFGNGSLLAGVIGGKGTSGYLGLWSNTSSMNSSNIYQGANGWIGIGTVSPSATLHLFSNTSGATPSLLLGGSPGNDTDFWIARVNNNDNISNDYLEFGNGTTPGVNPLMTFDWLGRLGIGTTTPNATLQLTSVIAGANPSMIIGGMTGNDTDFWIARVNNNDNISNDYLEFGNGTAPGNQPYLTLDSTGRFGINITTPQNTLNVKGDINATGQIHGANGQELGRTLIGQNSLSAPTRTLLVDYDPTGYDTIEYDVFINGTSGGTASLFISFNNVSTASYAWSKLVAATTTTGASATRCAIDTTASALQRSFKFEVFNASIPTTPNIEGVHWDGLTYGATVATVPLLLHGDCAYYSSSTIKSVNISGSGANNLAAGSFINVYGS